MRNRSDSSVLCKNISMYAVCQIKKKKHFLRLKNLKLYLAVWLTSCITATASLTCIKQVLMMNATK